MKDDKDTLNFYMGIAEYCGNEKSKAVRKKVGAILVKDDNIIAHSWNGTPSGWDNTCEDKSYMGIDAGGWLDPETIEEQWPYEEESGRRYALVTKPEVLHAEANAMMKVAKSTYSSEGSWLFVTLSPCIHCAKMIRQAGIDRVYYREKYRIADGIDFLKKCKIPVRQLK